MPEPKQKRKLFLLFDILVLAMIGLYVFAGRNAVPFHGDEATLIRMSRDYHYIFHEYDLKRVFFRGLHPSAWNEEQLMRVMTGAVNHYAVGIAWDLAGRDYAGLNDFWAWDPPQGMSSGWNMWRWNMERGNVPDRQLLQIARTPSTVFTILSVIVVFGIARHLTPSRWAAWGAALIYATTPAVLVNGRRAMQEGTLLFFTALLIYVTVRVVQEHKQKRICWNRLSRWYILLGVTSGLAAASKHNAAFVIMAAYLAAAASPLLSPEKQKASQKLRNATRNMGAVIGSGLLSVAFFLSFTPVWWVWWQTLLLWLSMAIIFFSTSIQVAGRWIWSMRGLAFLLLIAITVSYPTAWSVLLKPMQIDVRVRQWMMVGQAHKYGRMGTLGERARELTNELFFAGTEYFEVPNCSESEEIKSQIAAYESAMLNGRGGGLYWGIALIILVILGARAMLVQWWPGEILLVFFWLVIPAVLLLETNPLPWQRYYIILHAQLGIIGGMGLRHIEEVIVPVITQCFSK